jgi:hypothetical protein
MSTGRPPGGSGTDADQVCPVCHWPDRGAAVCGECGWQLLGDYVLGPATWSDQRDFAARLAGWQCRHDLRAAARAAGSVGDRDLALLVRLAGLARGGPPSRAQVERAAAEVDAADPPVALTSAGTGFALTRLVAGQTGAIAFVELGPDAVSLQTLVAGPLGEPARLVGDSLRWTDVLPLLPHDDDLRHLRMAGGIGVAPADDGPGPDRDPATPAALIDVMDEAIRPALTRLMAAASAAAASQAEGAGRGNGPPSQDADRLDIVLVRRTSRWPVLDAAIMRARMVIRPVAEVVVPVGAGDLATVMDDVAGHAPLRHGYDLVLVDVDADSGAVTVKPHKLFSAAAAVLPGTKPTVLIDVAAVPGHAADRLALPIVARRGVVTSYRDPAVLEDRRPLVRMTAMDGRTTGTTRMRVTLLRPGRVKVQAAPGLLPSRTLRVEWPGLITGLPARVSPPGASATRGLDLVLLVELGGAAETVAARVSLAQEVIDVLTRSSHDAPGEEPAVKVSVVGYRDHFGKHRVDAIGKMDQEHQALVAGFPLIKAAWARSEFRRVDRWHEVPVGDYHAAPIEDALQIVAGTKWQWQPQARHVLLVIGGRPPHPDRAGPFGDAMLPCPHRFSWPSTLDRLRAAQGVECYAVLDRPVTPGYAEQAWRRFAGHNVYPAGSVNAEQLARMVGLALRTASAEICLAKYVTAAPTRSREGKEAAR